VLAVLAALAYTGGPFPYGYRALGEVFVFVFFVLVAVAGTAYLQTLSMEPLYLVAAVPPGALITAILVVNNLRDMPTDAAAGKRTLAVVLGRRGTQAEFALLLAVAYVVPVAIAAAWLVSGQAPDRGVTTIPDDLGVLLPLLTLPMARPLWRTVRDFARRASSIGCSRGRPPVAVVRAAVRRRPAAAGLTAGGPAR